MFRKKSRKSEFFGNYESRIISDVDGRKNLDLPDLWKTKLKKGLLRRKRLYLSETFLRSALQPVPGLVLSFNRYAGSSPRYNVGYCFCYEVSADQEGMIAVPESAIDFLLRGDKKAAESINEDEGQVVVAGAKDRIEIWSRENWPIAQRSEAIRKNFLDIMDLKKKWGPHIK
jgi:hypothetical protein